MQHQLPRAPAGRPWNLSEFSIMSSPNLNKSPVEQALCVARALMVRSPALCNSSVAMDAVLVRLMREGRFVYDEWFRVVEDSRERYVIVFKGGGGQSLQVLPEGRFCVFTIDVRGQTPVTDAFERFVGEYEQGSVSPHPFDGLLALESRCESYIALSPDPAISARLRKSVEACSPSYNLETIIDFRRSCGTNTTQVKVQDRMFRSLRQSNSLSYVVDLLVFDWNLLQTQICAEASKSLV